MADAPSNSHLSRWSAHCNGRLGCTKPIATAFALRETMGENSCLLAGGIEPYKMIVPEFQQVAVTTMGEASLLTDFGQINVIDSVEQTFLCPLDKVTVLTAHKAEPDQHKCLTALSNADLEGHRPPAFYVFDEAGTVIHRVDLTNSDDALIMASSCSALDRWDGSARLFKTENQSSCDHKNVVSIVHHLKRRKDWGAMQQPDHLNDILSDGGKSRFRSLQYLGAEYAFETKPEVLTHFLGYLVERKISFTRIVTRPRVLQAHRGYAQYMHLKDKILSIYSGHSIMALDVSAINSIWVVNYQAGNRQELSLEIFDRNDNCLAVISCDPEKTSNCYVNWTELLKSLPIIA